MSIRDAFVSKVELNQAMHDFSLQNCTSRTPLRINHETGQCSLSSESMLAPKLGSAEVSSELANSQIIVPGGPGSSLS